MNTIRDPKLSIFHPEGSTAPQEGLFSSGALPFFEKKKIPKREIECPDCGHRFEESRYAVQTICPKCLSGICLAKSKTPAKVRRKRAKPATQEIGCLACSEVLTIPKTAISWQCHTCGAHLDFLDQMIDHEVSYAIRTYGDLTITPQGYFSGNLAEVENALVSGTSKGKIVCRKHLTLLRQACLHAGASGDHLVIEKNAMLECQQLLHFRTAKILGRANIKRLVIDGHLEISSSAQLRIDHLIFGSISIQTGAKLLSNAVSWQSLANSRALKS